MLKQAWGVLLLGCLVLSGCGSDSKNPDLDGDGVLNTLDCAPTDADKWQIRTYQSQDNDSDGKFVAVNGEFCTGYELPSGYRRYETAPEDIDCNDESDEVWDLTATYKDGDGDGYGVGEEEMACISSDIPEGTAIISGDCDDTNASIWRMQSYQAQDLDLDGVFIPSQGELCIGNVFPSEYSAAPLMGLTDCNDADNKVWQTVIGHVDSDGDGYGIGSGEAYCIGNELADNLSVHSTDCDDANPAIFERIIYQAIDMDLDGYQLASIGEECTAGTLSSTYQLSFDRTKIADCDDSNASIWRDEITFLDADQDSFGGQLNRITECIGTAASAGRVFDDTDCNDTDDSIWRNDLAYYDIDGDGIGAGEETEFCTNESAAPSTSYYHYDCDDNDADVFRQIAIYADEDDDGVGSGQGVLTCMGNTYLEENVSIYGYDPEPENPEVSNFDLSPAILAVP